MQESTQLDLARLSVKFRRPTRQPRRVAASLNQHHFSGKSEPRQKIRIFFRRRFGESCGGPRAVRSGRGAASAKFRVGRQRGASLRSVGQTIKRGAKSFKTMTQNVQKRGTKSFKTDAQKFLKMDPQLFKNWCANFFFPVRFPRPFFPKKLKSDDGKSLKSRTAKVQKHGQ